MVNIDRITKTFLDLVTINSQTFRERKVADYIKNKIKSFGLVVIEDDVGSKINGDCGNLLIRLSANTNGPCLMFSAHMDTVNPGVGIEPQVVNGLITSKEDTILGADDKSGIASIIELIEVLVEKNIHHPEIEIVFTVAEEKGLSGSKNLDKDWIKADYCYILDGEGKPGKIVIRSPFQNSVEGMFKGKSAHAGVEPEKGINAIQAASIAISKMKLGRVDENTTCNIGYIKGGIAVNIVPDNTIIKGEIRSHVLKNLEKYTEKMIRNLNKGAEDIGAKVEVKVVREFDGYNFDINDEAVILANKAISELNIKTSYATSGGGSDTNIFNQAGIKAITLSTGMKNAHSTGENILIRDMVKTTEILLNIIKLSSRT